MVHSRPQRDREIRGTVKTWLNKPLKMGERILFLGVRVALRPEIYLVMETVSAMNVNEDFCFLLAPLKFSSPSIGLTLPPGSTCLPVVFICLEGFVKILNSGY